MSGVPSSRAKCVLCSGSLSPRVVVMRPCGGRQRGARQAHQRGGLPGGPGEMGKRVGNCEGERARCSARLRYRPGRGSPWSRPSTRGCAPPPSSCPPSAACRWRSVAGQRGQGGGREVLGAARSQGRRGPGFWAQPGWGTCTENQENAQQPKLRSSPSPAGPRPRRSCLQTRRRHNKNSEDGSTRRGGQQQGPGPLLAGWRCRRCCTVAGPQLQAGTCAVKHDACVLQGGLLVPAGKGPMMKWRGAMVQFTKLLFHPTYNPGIGPASNAAQRTPNSTPPTTTRLTSCR